MRPTRCTRRLLVAGAALGTMQGCAETPRAREAFVELLGSDTVAIESVRSWDGGFEGTVLVRSPETLLMDYWAVREDGRLVEYGVQWRSPEAGPESPPLGRTTLQRAGDTAIVIRTHAGETREERVWVPDDVVPLPGRIPPPPLLAYAPVGMWREIAGRLAASGEGPHLLGLGESATLKAVTRPMARWGDDSIGVRVISGFTVGRLNPEGELVSISGEGTTVAVEVVPADRALDLEALAAEYSARDRRGEGFGHPSPAVRIEASVDGATLEILYSRPARRGRPIWGGLVPYGEVWRTGANLATHLETDRDLLIADTRVPAGRYTLWTLVRPDGALLIVNRSVDVWGTQYAPEEDLARIPLTSRSLGAPVERFTIEIEPADSLAGASGGVLSLAWDRTRFSVPVRVP